MRSFFSSSRLISRHLAIELLSIHTMKFSILIFCLVFNAISSRDIQKCRNRPVDFTIGGISYFFSDFQASLKNRRVGWAEAREICRSFCMDTISINTQKEFEVMKNLLEDNLVDYIWTSGHECVPKKCSQPREINGWLWMNNNQKIPPTNKNPPGWSFNPWSHTGFLNRRQPDNAEFTVNRKNESCLGVLHNVYDDGIKFHDVACYHKKPFICEDSEELLKGVWMGISYKMLLIFNKKWLKK